MTDSTAIGMNLDWNDYYSTEFPFINRMKSASSWFSYGPNSTPVTVGADGYPTALAAGNVTYCVIGLDPVSAGTDNVYQMTWTGTANFQINGATILSSDPGKIVFRYDRTDNNQTALNIGGLDPANPVGNIAIVRSDQVDLYNQGQIFNPAFLSKISQFDTLRYMDWASTNQNQTQNWSDRTTVNDATWQSSGNASVPLEVEVALANQTKTNMWLNVPTEASDDYVRQMMTYVHDHLDPSLTVNLEYSNEVWNFGFQQAGYASAQADKLWGTDANGDGVINPNDPAEHYAPGWVTYYGYRAAQVANIANQVFGTNGDRLHNVLSTMTAYTGIEGYIFDGVARANLGTAASLFTDYAVTTYFNGGLDGATAADQATILSWAKSGDAGLTAAFAALKDGTGLSAGSLSLAWLRDTLTYQSLVAQKYGLKLVAYEGGVDLSANTNVYGADAPLVAALFKNLQADSRMGDIYAQMVDEFGAAGGKLLNPYTDVRQDGFGALKSIYDSGSTEWDALVAAQQAHLALNPATAPVTTTPVTTPPVNTTPVTTPPVDTTPVTTTPVDTTPVTTPPVNTTPVTTTPVTTTPVTTPPVTTPPVNTTPVTTPPVDTTPVTTTPVTTPPVNTTPVTTTPVTTPPVTTPPVNTTPVTTPPVDTTPVTTPPVNTTPVTTTPVTTPPVDTTPVTTTPVTTPPVNTTPVTTTPVTTPPVTTTPVTTPPVNTTPVTTTPVTTPPVNTTPVTTTPVTTPPVDTTPVTTTPVTTPPVNTTPVTTTPVTTTPVTTPPVTTPPVNTTPVTTTSQPVVLAPGTTDQSSYTLASGEQSITYVGTGRFTAVGNDRGDTITAGDGGSSLTGGAGSDVLIGGAGNDYLDGGTGIDRMVGGAGDDTYVVDDYRDQVVELPGGGTDTIRTSLGAYVLPDNVENLTYTGSGSFQAIGNDLNNVIVGGPGGNRLSGGGGNDTLIGGAGNDILDGGSGADRMVGGAGDDIYFVDNPGDQVVEESGGGTDTVFSMISYALPNNVENLTLIGGSALNGTGNDLNNIIRGNSAANHLTGGAGDDTLDGGEGNDVLDGGDGNDVLIGGPGADILTGGAGADRFVFRLGDCDADPAKSDTITDFSRTDGDKIDLSAMDAGITGPAHAFTFIGTGAFTHKAGELRVDTSGNLQVVYGDLNGDGIADFAINVSKGSGALIAADFVL